MANRARTSRINITSPDQALRELLSLPVASRLEAVAQDLRRRRTRYDSIPPHDLAEALGIPQAEHPGPEWVFISYAHRMSVEDYAASHDPASELVYFLEGSVDPDRFAELVTHSEQLDHATSPDFSFLAAAERSALEEALAREQLESNQSNGMCCIARCSVKSPSGATLEFEGDLEDDGECIFLRTPYDKRAGRFIDLSDCVTTASR